MECATCRKYNNIMRLHGIMQKGVKGDSPRLKAVILEGGLV